MGAFRLPRGQRPDQPVGQLPAAGRPPAAAADRDGRGPAPAGRRRAGVLVGLLDRPPGRPAGRRGDPPGLGVPAGRLPACDRHLVAGRRPARRGPRRRHLHRPHHHRRGRRGRRGARRRPADAPAVGPGHAVGVGLPHPRRRMMRQMRRASGAPER